MNKRKAGLHAGTGVTKSRPTDLLSDCTLNLTLAPITWKLERKCFSIVNSK